MKGGVLTESFCTGTFVLVKHANCRHDLHQRFHPSMKGGDLTEAAMGALKKVMTMQVP